MYAWCPNTLWKVGIKWLLYFSLIYDVLIMTWIRLNMLISYCFNQYIICKPEVEFIHLKIFKIFPSERLREEKLEVLIANRVKFWLLWKVAYWRKLGKALYSYSHALSKNQHTRWTYYQAQPQLQLGFNFTFLPTHRATRTSSKPWN